MEPYAHYHEDVKRSKDDLEKSDVDSTACGSDSPTNEEGASLLYKRDRGSRSRSSALTSYPFLILATGLTIFSLLAMNIATLMILRHRSWDTEASQLQHKHDHGQTSATHNAEESVTSGGLRIAANGKLLECGEKAKDAEANGCIFDIMSFEWTPPACYDEEMLLDTVDPTSVLAPSIAGVFPWYRWANFTEPLEQKADVLSAFPYVWTNQDWHRGHCLYMWRLLVKAENQVLNGEKGVYVPAGATNAAHIAHCNLLISDKVDGSIIPLEAFRTVTSCVRLDRPDWTAALGAKANFGG